MINFIVVQYLHLAEIFTIIEVGHTLHYYNIKINIQRNISLLVGI